MLQIVPAELRLNSMKFELDSLTTLGQSRIGSIEVMPGGESLVSCQ